MSEKKTRKPKKKAECGKSVGILCSELFQKRFDVDWIKILILFLCKKRKYYEFFNSWPKLKKQNTFEPTFFEQYAKRLYVEILEEIKQKWEEKEIEETLSSSVPSNCRCSIDIDNLDRKKQIFKNIEEADKLGKTKEIIIRNVYLAAVITGITQFIPFYMECIREYYNNKENTDWKKNR